MKFIVTIEETIVQNFEVEATSLNEAIDKGIEKYNAVEFVLENPSVTETRIGATNCDSGENSDMIEF